MHTAMWHVDEWRHSCMWGLAFHSNDGDSVQRANKVCNVHVTLKGTISSRSTEQGIGLTQWLKIISHMIRSYCCCCCLNEPVIFSHCVHLKLGHRFHALLKVCSDRNDTVPYCSLEHWGTTYKCCKYGTSLIIVKIMIQQKICTEINLR